MLYPSSINAIKSDNNQGINRISIYNLILEEIRTILLE